MGDNTSKHSGWKCSGPTSLLTLPREGASRLAIRRRRDTSQQAAPVARHRPLSLRRPEEGHKNILSAQSAASRDLTDINLMEVGLPSSLASGEDGDVKPHVQGKLNFLARLPRRPR